jgi:insulysin
VFFVVLLVWPWDSAFAGKRETKTLTLANGLDVMLVHDAEVHRSAAALAVGVGQIYDTDDAQGLAHYLEHMLFLGTEKFPEADSYKKYLGEHSGASNAFTAEDLTNYFFQVSHDAFAGALDRFSRFFAAPLFDKQYAEREINAVSSEHDKNKLDDGWRAGRVRNLVSEPGHPIRRFGTGTKETLAGVTREKLLEFYNKYYSAGNMKLVLLSNRTLKEQEALAVRYFADIRNFPVTHPTVDSNYRRPLAGKYRLLKIKAIKDVRALSLEFPTIRLADYKGSKPEGVVGWVLGYEGKGSLLSKLKDEGLALGLTAGGGYDHPNLNSISIGIALTALGVERYERVMELVFSYIDFLRKREVAEYTFKEQQAMAQIDFDWKDPDEGMGYVAGKASLMHRYAPSEVETLPFLYKKYDPAAYRALLDTMVPENLLAVLETNDVAVDQTEQFYGTEYSLTEVGGEKFSRLKHPVLAEGMAYPEPNRFIPYGLKLAEEKPHWVKNDALGKVWFQFDHRFNQPKVFMSLRLQTPRVYDTPEHYALAKLYSALVQESLNEEVYPIEMAGLTYKLSLNEEGVDFAVGGYSQRINDLIELVSGSLIKIKMDEGKFADVKEAILRDLKNRKMGQAYLRAVYYSGLLLYEKAHGEDDLIRAIQPLTLNDVRRYAERVYERAHLTGAVYGNWTETQILASLDILLRGVKSRTLPEKERFKQRVEKLPPGEKIRFSRKTLDNNNALIYLIQAGERNADVQARAGLIGSIVESDFFTQLRTNQQLGYVVWSTAHDMENRMFLQFIIQSADYGPFDLEKRVEEWLLTTKKLFDDLTPEEFDRYKDALIVSIEKKGDSIADELADLFYAVTEREADFDHKKKLVSAVRALTLDEVRKSAAELLRSDKPGRLAILMRAKQNGEPVPAQVIGEPADFKKRIKSAPAHGSAGKAKGS